MTEQEWLACTDPGKMLCVFRGRLRNGYNRKIRLFACACCRLIWEHLVDERSRNAVEVAERHADGKATDDELKIASTAAMHAHQEVFDRIGKTGACMEWAAEYAADAIPFHGARNVSWMAATPRWLEIRTKRPSDWDEIREVPCTISKQSGPLSLVLGKWKVITLTETEATGAEKPVQIVLLHDIFGNPFQPVTINPKWLTPNVVAVAQTIYEQRRFQDIPILADALEEAGCTNAEVLGHCRSEGPHVRGCWVVDLILGKQ
jgi:hypothetical protein